MINRKTSRFLGEIYARIFRKYNSSQRTNTYPSTYTYYTVNTTILYDFLYDHEYATWFCNKARGIRSNSSTRTRPLKDFIMKLHTGETQYEATKGWSWEDRRQLGQRYLFDLAQDILNYWHNEYDERYKEETKNLIDELVNRLELDGYIYLDSRLLASEEDVLDVQEITGVLESLFSSLNLGNRETAFHHLNLSEEHYVSQKWDDSISNSRKFLECVLQEVAAAHCLKMKNHQLSQRVYTRPVAIRDYLEDEGLLEKKEKETIAKVYGLLSHTGGHPYMAQNDQARLLRHLALTFSQFVMLRFQGSLKSTA